VTLARSAAATAGLGGAPAPTGTAATPVVVETPAPSARGASRWLATVMVGRSLRLNNPYRLATPLGATPESLSLTAPYLDLAVGWTTGPLAGLQHGAMLGSSVALAGIRQQTVTPGYLAVLRPSVRWHLRSRLGVPVVLGPDTTAGIEAGVGGAWYARAGLGLSAEVSGSLFFGAATPQRERTTIPLIGLSIGGVLDFEGWR
jgi:hypothetical protein